MYRFLARENSIQEALRGLGVQIHSIITHIEHTEKESIDKPAPRGD
jgi:hypothetical protein